MELIIKNTNDFNTLRKYATYSSSLTGVLEIPDNIVATVFKEQEKIISKYLNKEEGKLLDENKPVVILACSKDKPKLYIDNADAITSLYLDLPFDKEIKRDSFDKLIELIKLDVIKLSSDVAKLFSRDLTDNSPIESLFSSNFTTNYKHKRISLNLLFPDGKISDLDFFNAEKREVVFSKFNVYQGIKINSITADNKILGKDHSGIDYELRFFYLGENKKSILSPGMEINVMADKSYGGNKRIIINPEIIPATFPKTCIRQELKTNKRDIPSKLLKVAWAEYSYRMREDM